MRLRQQQRDGFTLIEISIAIGILSFGLTAILVVYLTSLRWAEEIRIDMTSLHTARAAVFDAGVITDENNVSLGHNNKDALAEGYVNDYYVVRSLIPESLASGLSTLGTYAKVRVEVYYGGDKLSGTKVQTIDCDQIIYAGYSP